MIREEFIKLGKENDKLKVFAIPITWVTEGTVQIKARNGEEAMEHANEIGLSDIPFGFETIDKDSIKINWDSKYMGSYEKVED